MSCGRTVANALPFTLPVILGDEDFYFRRELKNSSHVGFRRVYLKRRLVSGEYEDDWQEIESRRIMSYGSTSISIDDKKLNFFDQSGITIKMDNSDGYFADESYRASFWNGYLSQYRTQVKVVAGYDVGCEVPIEVPVQTTLFYGILTDEVEQSRDNVTTLKFRSIASVFTEVNAGDLNLSSVVSVTADNLIRLVRDHTDTNSITVFQKFISQTAWDIASTTATYPNITTTSLESLNCLEMMKRLAEAERFVLYVDDNANFVFTPRQAGSSVVYQFFGGARYSGSQAHTILSINKYADAVQKVYNRISIKFNKADTSTSYAIAAEDWTWGDSSSSFKFGVRELALNNDWFNTAGAAAAAGTLLNEFSQPKKEITFVSKFFPGLRILDRISVSYSVINEEASLWGTALINRDLWAESIGQHNEFRNKEFYILKIAHNIDKFTTEITGREP